MEEQNLHEGERLRWFIEKKFNSYKEFINKAQLNSYQNLEYYFHKEQIKREKLKTLCGALGISITDFFKTVNKPEEKVQYATSKHHGRNLQTTLTGRGVNIQHFANLMKVSRPTVYNWFDEKELEDGVLLKAAQVLHIPVAQLKGIGTGAPGFEKDIYLLLQDMKKQLSRIEQKLPSR